MKKAVKYIVEVPGSSGNFGCGFDVLAAALDVGNRFEFTVKPGDFALDIKISGFGAGILPDNSSNAIWQSALALWRKTGFNYKKIGSVSIKTLNRIPLMKGMGSSATARVAGALFANEVSGAGFDKSAVLEIVAAQEGHYDNAAASLLGGIVICDPSGGKALTLSRGIKNPLCIAVPDIDVSTDKARKILPKNYTREDVVFNLSRISALIDGIYRGRVEPFMFDDRIHTPYRKKFIKGFDSVEKAALKNGAIGVFISGSGSSVGAIAKDAKCAGNLARAMKKAFASRGVKCEVIITSIAALGAEIKKIRRLIK
ncbi:homoserine kinase [bacterium]|nr:homoserine kinase [bacterium]MBU4133788.1 homoserine kinase [bacterium]